ncbi:MAG: DNA sulfur modification protein DndD [Sulfuritalea sp.]|nr:DNA sulfur modification protein DndD [Sulfuritalea sp.]MDP1984960.1 DNA sulfur modification protein DndD [Sulfuritalea sp.]
MIFELIELNNLYSYRGIVRFDLSGASAGRNVVLISGRNGFGKTSFLNAVKLLFCDVTASMRESVQRQRTPTHKQYVVGAGEDWWGILNRQARQQDGERNCHVRIAWSEGATRITAQRSWVIEDNDFTTNLVVESESLQTPLRDSDAQVFISARLPPDFVPFFIFDGEQIQELAEANRAEQIDQIERLLNISALKLMSDTLTSIRKEFQNQGMDQTERATLVALRGNLTHEQAAASALKQQLSDLRDDIDQAEVDARTLRARVESRRAFVHQGSENQLKRRLEDFEANRSSLANSVVNDLPRVAPLLLNPLLTDKAARLLDMHRRSNSGGDYLRQVAAGLPDQVFGISPPQPISPLSPEQQGFFRNRLAKLLEAALPDDRSNSNPRLDIPKAERAQRLLRRYGDNQELRRTLAAQLEQLFRLRGQIKACQEENLNIGALSTQEREAYQKDLAEAERLEEERVVLRTRQNGLEKDIRGAAAKIEQLETDIAKQENAVELSSKMRDKAEIAARLRRFFDDYKQRLKDERRADLEAALNRHFHTLMTSHKLIARIQVDEEFGLHYLDVAGHPVGMGNLSAGMKQLAATALLWALKECSGRPLPIVVDTPLARIDRGNQENLLTNYYPAASEQVIVLPTDSELDEAKYRLLHPYVYREYKLHNPSGDQTTLEEISMYPEVARA